MNPIPTTNAMKPAPGKGVSSFPTPVIKDTVIVEVVNAWKGDYTPLEYGTKWDDVPHASVQGSYPDHKLINQAPNSEDGQWVKRIWANDRVDQDTYNYAIKYSGGSDAHPIYIRTYILPRETYQPVQDLSPDPLFPGALLVDEEVARTEGELDSRYVQVTRVYETLPGPIISSQRVNDRGDLETIEVQEVDPNTSPDPDGLFVTQTQVVKEDVSKGTKTTATVESYSQLLVKEKKEGLLGETVTTDDIVDPSTQPDELSQSIVASVVQQTSATKAVKRTTTASGPTSLSKRSNDGKLLGNVTSTQSVVSPSTTPDAPSNSILSSEVSQVDSGKAIKTNVVLVSTPTLQGEDKKPGLLGTTTATETVVPAGTSADALSQTIVSSTVEPIDSVRSRKVTVESSGPTQLTGKRINQRGDIETISESIVPAGTNAGPDGLLVISSEVEPIDSAKSKITTSTVPSHSQLAGRERKSGLLANTTTSDNIVSPGAQPDNLTFTGTSGIIESTIQPISATKSKKVTITSTGPVKLDADSLVDSPLGLVKANIEKSIVTPDTQPTSSPTQGLTTIRDNIEALDAVKSQRELVKVDEWPTNTGVNYDEQLGLGIYYTETIVKPSDYINPEQFTDISNKDYKPIDQWKSLERSYDKDKIRESLLSQWYKIATDVDISLPDKLLGATVYWGRSGGVGKSFETNSGGSTGSYSLSSSGSWKNSAAINGDIYFNVQQGFRGAIPGFQHIFFLEIGNDGRVDSGDILDVLNNLEAYGQQTQPSPSFNDSVQIVSVQRNAGTSIVTTTNHGLFQSLNIQVASGSQASFNGSFFANPISTTSFQYSQPGEPDVPLTSASGIVAFINPNIPIPQPPPKKYKRWPYLQARSENLVIVAGGKSERFNRSQNQSVNINGFSSGMGEGSDIDVDVNARSINVPQTLHGQITIGEQFFGSFVSGLEPTYFVQPKTLATTTAVINGQPFQAPTFPTGEYLYSSNVELYKYGFVKVSAITVNITNSYV